MQDLPLTCTLAKKKRSWNEQPKAETQQTQRQDLSLCVRWLICCSPWKMFNGRHRKQNTWPVATASGALTAPSRPTATADLELTWAGWQDLSCLDPLPSLAVLANIQYCSTAVLHDSGPVVSVWTAGSARWVAAAKLQNPCSVWAAADEGLLVGPPCGRTEERHAATVQCVWGDKWTQQSSCVCKLKGNCWFCFSLKYFCL